MLDLALRVFRVNAAARRVLERQPPRAEVSRVIGEIAQVQDVLGTLAPATVEPQSAQMIYGWVMTLERARKSLERRGLG